MLKFERELNPKVLDANGDPFFDKKGRAAAFFAAFEQIIKHYHEANESDSYWEALVGDAVYVGKKWGRLGEKLVMSFLDLQQKKLDALTEGHPMEKEPEEGFDEFFLNFTALCSIYGGKIEQDTQYWVDMTHDAIKVGELWGKTSSALCLGFIDYLQEKQFEEEVEKEVAV
ncbi:MAG: hypothetical protein K6G62_00810 [Eubacterium sp.]|nr:hypothetical protein [Eubacterium sp.]